MTTSPTQTGGSQPADVPNHRPAAFDRLEGLVGRWRTTASFAAGFFGPDSPPVAGGGDTTFEWFVERSFLIQRASADQRGAPTGIMLIGAGPEPDSFLQHYFDSRGVARTYHMTLDDKSWRLWRESPGFWQRFKGVFSDQGRTITGAWEKSVDGWEWEHDFNLSYVKVD